MSKPDHEYGILATSWDAFRGDTSAWEDRSFYLEAIHRFGEAVLDVGCATGCLLINFRAQGIDVEGVDVSPEMVALSAATRPPGPASRSESTCRRWRSSSSIGGSFASSFRRARSSSSWTERRPPWQMGRFVDHLQHGGALVMPFMTLRRGDDPLEAEAVVEVTRQGDGAIVRRTSRSRFDPASSLEQTDDLYEMIVGGRVTEVERHIRAPGVRLYAALDDARALFEDAGVRRRRRAQGVLVAARRRSRRSLLDHGHPRLTPAR